MRNVPTLAARELGALFVSPILYVVLVLFLVLNGISFWIILYLLSQPMAPEGAPMQLFFGGSVLYWLPTLLMTAVIPMGTIAAERRSGTIETLMTAPVTELEVVVAKFLACFVFYVILWVPTLLYVVVLSRYGDPDLGPIWSGYLGTLMLGAAMLSIGILASTTTQSQTIAAVIAFVSQAFLFVVGLLEFLVLDPSKVDTFRYLNLWSHMADWGRGVVDTRHIVYYATVMLFCLFCSVRVLEGRRWR